MSNPTNDALLEEAKELIDYWEGKLHAKRMRDAMERNDLDSLHLYVREAREAMLMLECGYDEN